MNIQSSLYNDFFDEIQKIMKYIRDNGVEIVSPYDQFISLHPIYFKMEHKKYNALDQDLLALDVIYKNIINKLNNESLFEWVNAVDEFGYFIRFAEKVLFFDNSDQIIGKESKIYAENSEKDKSNTIYFIFDNYKAKIQIIKTEIDSPINISLLQKKLFLEDNKVSIIKITIERTYGKRMSNYFEFISDENLSSLDNTDILLIEHFRKNATDLLLKTFNRIIDSYIEFYLDNKILLEEISKYGLWVRRGTKQ